MHAHSLFDDIRVQFVRHAHDADRSRDASEHFLHPPGDVRNLLPIGRISRLWNMSFNSCQFRHS